MRFLAIARKDKSVECCCVIQAVQLIFYTFLKPLIKKYISLKTELRDLQLSLIETPEQGTLITTDVYKIRMGVKSKGRGKSGGLRIITFVETLIIAEVEEMNDTNAIEKIVNLIAIYDKTDTANIAQQEIENLLSDMDFDE